MNVWMRIYNPWNWTFLALGFGVICIGAYLHNYSLMIIGSLIAFILCWLLPEPVDKNNFIGRVVTGYRIWVQRPKSIWKALERIFTGCVIALSLWAIWQRDANAVLFGALALVSGVLLWMHAMERLCLSQPGYNPKNHASLSRQTHK